MAHATARRAGEGTKIDVTLSVEEIATGGPYRIDVEPEDGSVDMDVVEVVVTVVAGDS